MSQLAEHPVSGERRDTAPTATRWARRLSVLVAVLLTISSLAGVLVPGLYRDPDAVVAMLRANDLITLTLAVPLLVWSLVAERYGSPRAQLVRAGMLAYSVYTFATVVFGTAFNALFLVHVALFSLSVAALVLSLVALDVERLARAVSPRTPLRPVAVLLGLLGAGLGGMWVYYALRFALIGEPPEESQLVLPIASLHLAYVLDLALLVPGYLVAAVTLWRRAPWGYVIAGVLLTSGTLQQLQYMTGLLVQRTTGVPGAVAYDPAEPFIMLAFVAATVVLLAGLPADSGAVTPPRRSRAGATPRTRRSLPSSTG
ncbi:hypothetical protein ATJ97_0767 [Georgenia soli]|uniref:Uncharacterized protein n=1 Tax=Georgenia soli TaxID=638953 RepID=A0A2A9EHA0_9MICO|nr:hypothetical protein [Georgenia soli]PFG38294.1 hypothetical protein ATJ97_0767 [Georgenia soli]